MKGEILEERNKPGTVKEMVAQLWYCVIGTNGEGLASRIASMDRRLAEVEMAIPTLQTKHACQVILAEGRESRTKERRHRDAKRTARMGLTFGLIASLPAWITLVVLLVTGGFQ